MRSKANKAILAFYSISDMLENKSRQSLTGISGIFSIIDSAVSDNL